MSQENVTVIGRLYAAWSRGDLASLLACLREVAPIDHIAFGSDFPFARQLFEASASDLPDWATDLVPRDGDPAPSLGCLGPDERAQVDRGTAAALLPRLAGRA